MEAISKCTAPKVRHKTPHLNPENIRKSTLDFTAHFDEINPDMPYLCRRGQSAPPKGRFCLFPSTRRESIKNIKSLIFRKK